MVDPLPLSEWPDRAPASPSLERMLMAAVREPARNRMSFWSTALEEHRRHRSFRTHGWAFSREVGFTCECSGREREWRISITGLREMIPAARDAWFRISGRLRLAGNKKKKRDRKRADARAKALLHRHLTKEQRWELRATRSVTAIGQDGRTYQITEGSCNNVFLLVDGVPKYQLCAVARLERFEQLPVYDLMLAQKLLIENDIGAYLSVANATNVATGHRFSGSSLLGGWREGGATSGPDPDIPDTWRRPREVIRAADVVPDEALDDPGAWAMARLREAETHMGDTYGNGNGNADTEPDAGPARGGHRRDCPDGGGRRLEALLEQGQP